MKTAGTRGGRRQPATSPCLLWFSLQECTLIRNEYVPTKTHSRRRQRDRPDTRAITNVYREVHAELRAPVDSIADTLHSRSPPQQSARLGSYLSGQCIQCSPGATRRSYFCPVAFAMVRRLWICSRARFNALALVNHLAEAEGP